MSLSVHLPSRRRDTLSVSLRGYVLWWVAAGVAAVTATVAWSDPGPGFGIAFVVCLAMTAASEAVSVNLRAGRSGVALSLLEVAVVIDLLLLGPVEAVLAAVGGVTIQHLARRLPAMKVAFNAGQHAVGASVAALIVGAAPHQGPITVSRVAGVGLAVLVHRIISTAALAGVFTRVGALELREHLLQRPRELAASVLGNASIGVIAAAMWTAYPTVAWVVAAPAIALYLSYTAGYRIEALLSDVRHERDRLEQVVGGVREGIVLLDADGRVRVWNPAMTTILGIPAEQALGRAAGELLAGVDDMDVAVDPLALLRDPDQQTVTVTAHVPTATGERAPLRLSHTLLHDDDVCTGDVIVVHDLAREREAAALKEDFVARVSHELRTPLTPLRGYAQVLRRAGDDVPVEKRAEILGTMIERVGHLERLVDDLLLVSRIGSDRVDPAEEVRLAPVDVDGLVPRLVSWLAREQLRGHTIEVTVDEGRHVALADAMRTGQILTNLLTNACKYSAPGAPVTVRVTSDDDHVTVAVCDRGPGIPDDKLEAIFERFERLEDPQRMSVGGIGLGLYISRNLAHAMHGTLTVDSQTGVGSAFTLTLPRGRDDDPTPVVVPSKVRRLQGVPA